jgi:hypothetical protein
MNVIAIHCLRSVRNDKKTLLIKGIYRTMQECNSKIQLIILLSLLALPLSVIARSEATRQSHPIMLEELIENIRLIIKS